MSWKSGPHYIIAVKYSNTEIKSQKDVERFYNLLAKEYPQEQVDKILGELTDLLYNDQGEDDEKTAPNDQTECKYMKYPQDAEEFGFCCYL